MTSWLSFRRRLPSRDNFAIKHNKCDNLHGAPVDNSKAYLITSVTPTFANIASTHSTEDYIAKVGTLSLPSLTAHHIAESLDGDVKISLCKNTNQLRKQSF